ncbi:MAG: glycoside hydrolase family 3 C-terminal domain-containing protein [Salinivirgaceae bacterium]|jgi:beta-glucosidase|nr:glycoside hydrolase family 3 C-terminal domain-containing protein [Salinivirgaceae bacterium]
MKTLFSATILSIFLTVSCNSEIEPLYKDKNAPVEDRISDLVQRMTFDEKVLQLNQYLAGENTNVNNIGESTKDMPAGIGSLIYFNSDPEVRNLIQKKAMEESRLGIPILFGFDVIHGYRTIYPISLGVAASWNPELLKKACGVAAKEACLSGIDWTFSPMIDVASDPRWGRVAEGYGEDSYTNSVFGVAAVKGYQGESLSDPYSIAACLKHYIGYGRSEGGRDYRYSDISRQSLWETYMPPYHACVKAGAATLMSGFNDISGVPATANHYTLTEVLKKQWQHDGFVVSDWEAVDQLIAQGVAKDRKEAGLKAFKAGVEMDMKDNIYLENFKQLVDEDKLSISEIDDAVSRILRVKFRLGLFDEPYTKVVPESARYLQPQDKKVAEQLVEESIVLLKNEASTLPFSASVKKVALIGPMAKDKENLIGAWPAKGDCKDVESISEGFEKEFGTRIKVSYALGCDFEGDDESGFSEAISIAKKSDIVVVCIGEKNGWSGENATRSTIALPTIQEQLVVNLKKAGKPIVLVLTNGRPLELVRLEPLVDAIVELWQPGVAGGSPLAGILSGRVNPSAKLAITFPLTTGQIPTYYNMRQCARPFSKMGDYQDISTEPLYWFGHGLSYTTYQYGTAKLSASQITREQKLTVDVTVSNTGKMDGKETVLWYISDPACSISRPIKELKFFEKKEIKAGEKTVYTFEIDPLKDLSYPDETGKYFLEQGDFYVHVGDQKLKFELIK